MPCLCIRQQRKFEVGPLARLRFHPDTPSMTFDDLAADGQTDACAWVFNPVMQPLEGREDLLGVFWLEANAMILYAENPLRSMPLGRQP